MKFAIIAAGEGRRMAEEGMTVSKPMLRLGGEPLIGRLLRIFSVFEPSEIVVACRSSHADVIGYLEGCGREGIGGRHIPLRIVKATTPSSMHSLEAMSEYLGDEPFVLTTVDTIFDEKAFSSYVSSLESSLEEYDGCFAVTSYVDDEKPLYVKMDEGGLITGFYDSNTDDCPYVSGGIYAMKADCLEVLHECVAQGEMRMRNFQRALLRSGKQIVSYVFPKIIDVDHPSDLRVAEQFLAEQV
ncbi:MAG: NTP transferase domain-containing protein [Prevotella sp.]|nr:NTP transferase domain-containing protein [Prevotella sp.]